MARTDNNNGTTGFSAYPNPFNNSVVISYRLTSAQLIEVDLYTITGKKIKTLERAFRSRGGHTILWDGTSDNGNSVGSGLYFCTLRSKESLKTLKIILVKSLRKLNVVPASLVVYTFKLTEGGEFV